MFGRVRIVLVLGTAMCIIMVFFSGVSIVLPRYETTQVSRLLLVVSLIGSSGFATLGLAALFRPRRYQPEKSIQLFEDVARRGRIVNPNEITKRLKEMDETYHKPDRKDATLPYSNYWNDKEM